MSDLWKSEYKGDAGQTGATASNSSEFSYDEFGAIDNTWRIYADKILTSPLTRRDEDGFTLFWQYPGIVQFIQGSAEIPKPNLGHEQCNLKRQSQTKTEQISCNDNTQNT
jgi:hypothetical protein